MAKVIFSVQYEISSNKKEEYFGVVKELKNLLKADGLDNYTVYEVKGKPNHYQEIYTFSSNEAFEQFDDNQNERLNILINKLSDLTTENSTKYTTLYEVTEV
jgi:L-rhamnose mutarotase